MLLLLTMKIVSLQQDNVILLSLKSLQEQRIFYALRCVWKRRQDIFSFIFIE